MSYTQTIYAPRLSAGGNRRKGVLAFGLMMVAVLLAVGSCRSSQVAGAFSGDRGFQSAWQGQARIVQNPERLVSMKARTVRDILGLPALRREEPPAQVWQYRSAQCVMDLFLYEGDETGESLSVAHVEMRPRLRTSHLKNEERTAGRSVTALSPDTPRARRNCLQKVIAEGRKRRTNTGSNAG